MFDFLKTAGGNFLVYTTWSVGKIQQIYGKYNFVHRGHQITQSEKFITGALIKNLEFDAATKIRVSDEDLV